MKTEKLYEKSTHKNEGKKKSLCWGFDCLRLVFRHVLTSLNPEEWETFGWSVAVGAGLIVVGAYEAVYFFE